MLNPGESELVMTRDSEVEVCSEEEGFKGAWFRAILEENTTKTGRKRIRVRYLTLLSEDRLSSLVETVEQKFIRPVPKEEEYGSVVIEEGVVVDAYFKDGWWSGVVVKEVGNEEFLVLFDVPPDVIKFKKTQLRAHVDWNGWKWNVPDKKVLDKSVLSPGTMVEVRSMIDKAEEAWVPGMVVSAFEEDGKKKFLIKDQIIYVSCNGKEARTNTVVDAHRVRPIPRPSSVETFKLLETVEAFRNSKWCKGLVIGVLSEEESYLISFEGTKEQSVFKHGCVRPLRVWENEVWLDGPKENPIEESPSRILRKKAVSSSYSAKPMTPTNSVRLTRRSLNLEGSGETLQKCESVAATGGLRKKSVDAVMNETTSIATEAVTPVVIATPVKPTETETEGKRSEPARNQNGSGNDSNNNSTQQKVPEEEKSKDSSRKRKRNEQDNADLSESGEEACNGSKAMVPETNENICDGDYDQSPDAVKNSAGANEDTTLVLPFVKESPIWKAVESMDVFATVKQTPHFSPLFGIREEFREGTAVGEMVNFYSLLERVKNLQLDTPKSTLESLKECFSELEKYGFNVTAPASRIDMLLPLKDIQIAKVEELKGKDRDMKEKVSKKKKIEEDRREVKRKILELQSQDADLKEKEEALEEGISEIQLCTSALDKEIQNVEFEIQSIVAAPW